MTQTVRFWGIGKFLMIWSGQFTSLTGSALTSFALSVWVYEKTASVTFFTLILLFGSLPGVVAGPLIGVLVDLLDRRLGMMLSESIAGLAILVIALLLFADQLQVWHVAMSTTVISLCSTFQWSAYAATIPLLVSKQHLGQANGMVQVAQGISQIVAPTTAGLLMIIMSIQWILLIDVATFLIAILTLFVVRIPAVPRQHRPAQLSLRTEISYGWHYIVSRPGLFGLLLFLAVTNFVSTFVQVLLTPFVLNMRSPQALGFVLSSAGLGILIGSVTVSVWGGPERRIRFILGATLLRGLLLLLAGLPSSIPLIAGISTAYMLLFPFIASGSQAIWQSKVDPDVQGRVFATRYMIATVATPLAYLLAGPLVDHVFEPALAQGGPLARSVGLLLGSGAGRGFALLYVVLGVIMLIAAALAYQNQHVRNLEMELPDTLHDVSPEPAATS